jgi:sulfur relay (sulfurtransferase) complex TusBCD TusD component (DsrE family)
MLLILLLVTPAYAQEATTEPLIEPPPLTEQMQQIEEQVQVQVENTMAICEALGIVCEEEAAEDLVKALN